MPAGSATFPGSSSRKAGVPPNATSRSGYGHHVVVDHERLGGPVEHEAHRAVGGVLDDEHDRPGEVRVGEGRYGDEQLPAE